MEEKVETGMTEGNNEWREKGKEREERMIGNEEKGEVGKNDKQWRERGK